jgi:hypothetical protein
VKWREGGWKEMWIDGFQERVCRFSSQDTDYTGEYSREELRVCDTGAHACFGAVVKVCKRMLVAPSESGISRKPSP